MKKVTRVRVTERMARVVRYMHAYGSKDGKSAPEVFKGTNGAFPSQSATSVCLWNLARLGLLSRCKRRGGNGETPFKVSEEVSLCLRGFKSEDRRVSEVVRMIKELDERRANGG